MSITPCTHTPEQHVFERHFFCDKLSTIKKIAIVALHILTLFIPLMIYTIVNYFPTPNTAAITTGVSRATFKNNFKLRESTGDFSINSERLSDAPQAFDADELNASIGAKIVNLDEILNLWDKIIPPTRVLTDDGNRKFTWRELRDGIKNNLIEAKASRQPFDPKYDHPARKAEITAKHKFDLGLIDEIHLFLRGIILELKKNTISDDKKKEELELLALSTVGAHCLPRRHEETQARYLALRDKPETIDNRLLEYIQQTKEQLFLNYYSLSKEPVQTLNYIRLKVGQFLGLNTNKFNLGDQYINLNDARSPENYYSKHTTESEFLKTADKIFTTENFISNLKMILNGKLEKNKELREELTAYISGQLEEYRRQGKLTINEADPDPYFEKMDAKGYGSEFNDTGIRFLLTENKFLLSKKPNGHLVRQA